MAKRLTLKESLIYTLQRAGSENPGADADRILSKGVEYARNKLDMLRRYLIVQVFDILSEIPPEIQELIGEVIKPRQK